MTIRDFSVSQIKGFFSTVITLTSLLDIKSPGYLEREKQFTACAIKWCRIFKDLNATTKT